MEQTAPCSPTTWTRQFRITLPGSLRWNHNLILYLPALKSVDWIVCGSASCNTSTVNWWSSLAYHSILHSQENRVAAVTLRPEVLTIIRKQLLSFINVLWKSMMWIRFANFCGWWLLWTGDFWTYVVCGKFIALGEDGLWMLVLSGLVSLLMKAHLAHFVLPQRFFRIHSFRSTFVKARLANAMFGWTLKKRIQW